MKKIVVFVSLFFLIFTSPSNTEIGFFDKGKNLFNEKKFDLARFKFEQDIVYNPKNENSYLYLAKIYKIKKNDNLEEANLKTVILLNPKNEDALLNLALLKIRKSNYSETKDLIIKFDKVCKNLCNQSSNLQKRLDEILKK